MRNHLSAISTLALLSTLACLAISAKAQAPGPTDSPTLPKSSLPGPTLLTAPVAFFEDKSRPSSTIYDGISPVPSYLASQAAKDIDAVTLYSVGMGNKSDVVKALQELLYIADTYPVDNYNILYSVGAHVRAGDGLPTLVASTALLSINSLSTDVAYQHFAGPRIGPKASSFSPTGDAIAVKIDLTRGTEVRRLSQLREAYVRYRKAVYDLLTEVNTSIHPVDFADPGVNATVTTIISGGKILGKGKARGASGLIIAAENARTEYNSAARRLRISISGEYSSTSDVGTLTSGGISFSQLFARRISDSPAANRSPAVPAGLVIFAVNYLSTAYRQRFAAFPDKQDFRFAIAVAAQDRLPYIAPAGNADVIKKYGGVQRWTRQEGIEFVFPNKVEGLAQVGAYLRWRDHHTEFNVNAGVDVAGRRSFVQFGVLTSFRQ